MLEHGSSPKQQRMAQQQEHKTRNSRIIAGKLQPNTMHLNEVMIGVDE